jgi:hypothetical protein
MKKNVIHYINYSDDAFASQQRMACFFAKNTRSVNTITAYSRNDLDSDFRKKNANTLDKKRGGGFWLWKPYIITKKLREIEYGDYLLYSDSGAVLLKDPTEIISDMELIEQDFAGFELPLIERQWTKPSLFASLGCDSQKYSESNQILSSFHMIRKTKFSRDFYENFLDLCQKPDLLLDDTPNQVIASDYGFIDHRHDQSIFSLLYKSIGYKPMKDPSQMGAWPTGYAGIAIKAIEPGRLYKLDNGRMFRTFIYNQSYEEVFYHSRKNNPIYALARYRTGRFLHSIGLYNGIIK